MSSKNSQKTVKPVEKPDKFCMDIKLEKGTDYLIKKKEFIKDFVTKLYENEKFGDDKMNPEEINIILDTKGYRVCIAPSRKVNSIYIKFENIHKKITPDMLKINSKITLGKPLADILKHHLDEKDKKMKVPTGLKWVTLSHNGPYFTWIMEPYEPYGFTIIYDGKSYELNPQEEEIAVFYAKRIITDETAPESKTTDKLFNKNFWKDFKKYLSVEHTKIFTDFSKFSFGKIVNMLKKMKDETKTDKTKKDKKIKTEEKKAEYGYAIVNGIKEKIGAFIIEPSSIFLGRGKNKISGSIKRNIRPEEVTINVGKSDKQPIPPDGHKWKEVVHDQKAEWIAKWTDPLTDKVKHIYLSAEGQFKSDSDAQKFEKSRKLNRYIDYVRDVYKKYVDSSELEKRQLGTVIYLVDNYGIRIGGENDDSTADTFGASTLLVEHIKLKSSNNVTFEFLGKDSILYKQTINVPDRIFQNLEYFVKGKKKDIKIFDKVSGCDINSYLKTIDKHISAKVFRTRLGSSIMYNGLQKSKIKKNSTESEKIKSFENANILVANVLNHQRSIPKSSEKSIKKIETEIKEFEKELKTSTGKTKETIKNKLENKKELLDSKNNLKSIAISTSRTNYIDPRLVVAWCKKYELDLKKIYTPILQRKFKWAIDTIDSKWDYVTSDMLPGFEHLEPKILDSCNVKNKTSNINTSKKYKDEDVNVNVDEDDDEDDEDVNVDEDDDKPLGRNSSKKYKDEDRKVILFKSYIKMLKDCEYSVLYREGRYKIYRISNLPIIMSMKNTYKDIHDLCIEMKNNDMKYFALLLILAICKDARKYSEVNNIIQQSGYLEEYKNLVKNIL